MTGNIGVSLHYTSFYVFCLQIVLWVALLSMHQCMFLWCTFCTNLSGVCVIWISGNIGLAGRRMIFMIHYGKIMHASTKCVFQNSCWEWEQSWLKNYSRKNLLWKAFIYQDWLNEQTFSFLRFLLKNSLCCTRFISVVMKILCDLPYCSNINDEKFHLCHTTNKPIQIWYWLKRV